MFRGFLNIEEVDGESTDDAHNGWIEILSYNHGITQTNSGKTGGGGGAAKSEHEDFIIAKELD